MQKEIKEIKGKDFIRMQEMQTEMVAELDRVCREHDIMYQIWGGTLLGAVRHGGHIPWDDDMDIVMLREEYEKLKKVHNCLNPEICFFQDHDTDPGYRWGYGKLRRTGTSHVRVGQEHINCRTGIFVDILPVDDIPLSTAGQMLQDFHCFILRKCQWAEVGRLSDKGIKKQVYKLMAKVPIDSVFKALERYTSKSRNDTPNKVRTLCYTSIGKLYYKHKLADKYGMPKKWFLHSADYEFEGHTFKGVRDYDECLKFIYGDYMTLPPEDQREPHAPVSSYDLGE